MNSLSHPVAARPLTQATIDTRRTCLRPITALDGPSLRQHAGDLRVARGTRSIAHPLPADAVDAFVAAALDPARDEDVWVIDGSKSGAPDFLGVVSLKALERAQSQVGYWIVPAQWGAGFATEAVRALVEANPHGGKTMFAEVFKDNPASARLLTNLGFEYISDAEAWSVARACAVPTWTYLRRMG